MHREKSEVIIIASGSEVSLAVEAHEKLVAKHPVARGVMPSWEIFEQQPRLSRQRPATNVKARVAVEQASTSAGSDTSAAR